MMIIHTQWPIQCHHLDNDDEGDVEVEEERDDYDCGEMNLLQSWSFVQSFFRETEFWREI